MWYQTPDLLTVHYLFLVIVNSWTTHGRKKVSVTQNAFGSLLVSQPWVIVSRLQECQEALSDLQCNGMGL